MNADGKHCGLFHVHLSSPAVLTDFFTSSGLLAILSSISDECPLRHASDISTDKSASVYKSNPT
jgi:hypothetical protein